MPTTINGTGITFPNGTTQTTAATGAGTVTSVATGNGLSGGTITTSGTLAIACPTFNTVGSYSILGTEYMDGGTINQNQNYAIGQGGNVLTSVPLINTTSGLATQNIGAQVSGTWKWMSMNTGKPSWGAFTFGLACRVS